MSVTIEHQLSENQTVFIDEIASLLTTSGMPLTSARIYGLLLLDSAPISLDDMTDKLGISKSAASVAVKHLETKVMARRQREPGTKRILFSAPENAVGLLSTKSQLIKDLGHLLTARASDIATGATQQRIVAIGNFYLKMQRAIDELLTELKSSK